MENENKDNNLIGKLVFRLVRKHIAGSTSTAVLNAVKELNGKGMHTTVTLLNDHVDDQIKARYNTNAYMQFIKQLSRLHLDSSVSIRPSQIGAGIDEAMMESNMEEIIAVANSCNQRLWIENEPELSSSKAFDLYKKFKPKCTTLGVELIPEQVTNGASLAKQLSGKDMVKLRYRPKERKEKEKETSKEKVDRLNIYKSCIDSLMDRNVNLTILENDEKLIGKLVSSSKGYRRNLIFEIPLGYNSNRLNRHAKGKLNMSVYVPYGKDWIPYFINRLAEGRVRNIAITLLNGQKAGVDQNAKNDKGKKTAS